MGVMFPSLFQPGYIGKVKVKNRIAKAATYTGYCSPGGYVTARTLAHYRELAIGGAGLVIVEMAFIDNRASVAWLNQLGASGIQHLPGLFWLATTIKENGARACLQISHCGAQKWTPIPPIKAASPVPSEDMYYGGAPAVGWRYQYGKEHLPEEITLEEIREVIEDFGDAAFRAKAAGFDMVELHACHGYLITGFLSPRRNKRRDWYGGSLENRMQLLLQIVENIQRKCGADYPLSVRLSGTDYEEGGISIDETIEVAKALEKAGVQTLHISGGIALTIHKMICPSYMPLGYNVWAAEAIKKAVGIPIIASGSITTPELAEKILQEGKGDFVSLARPLFADPYWPKKAQEGRPEDISPCIRCDDGCRARRVHRTPVMCTTNVMVGREDELKIRPSGKPKRVLIVGGGPAGLEAARVAALLGHKVTLYEKRKLGGWLIEAAVPDFKADIRNLLAYQITEVRKLGVNVVMKEAGVEDVKEGFDAIIVATGSAPVVPDIRGLDRPIVVQAVDVFDGAKVGQTVIVVGGGSIGSDVALFLGEQGKKVIVVEMLDAIAMDLCGGMSMRVALFERLEKTKHEIYVNTCLEEIADHGIIAKDRSGRLVEFQGDNVVLALGMTSNDGLARALEDAKSEFMQVGDCVEPRKIYDAIHEGYAAARRV